MRAGKLARARGALLASLADPEPFLDDPSASAVSRRRYEQLEHGHLQGAVLVASGCVRVWDLDLDGVLVIEQAPNRHAGGAITQLGEMVLRFMGRARTDAAQRSWRDDRTDRDG